MFSSRFLLLCVPLLLLVPLWINLARHFPGTNKTTITAIACSTLVALWASSLYVRILVHPALLDGPPWQGVNLDAALLGLIGPVAVFAGMVAAFRGAKWCQVLLIELSSLPLSLIGCAAGISV